MELQITETEKPDEPSDVTPLSNDYGASDAEYKCQVCGKPLVYAGRGRKPKFCDDHKKSASKSTVKRSAASESQARAAAGLLAKINSMLGIGLMSFGMPMTAETLIKANEDFENMAYEALLNDPALCRKILSAGATSGKAGLVMAYGMLGVSVVPAAMLDIKARRAAIERDVTDD